MSEQIVKLLLVGDSSVGKSSLLTRFCQDKFSSAFYSTIGVDFKTKMMKLGGKNTKLQVWDTAGQQRFRTITASYYKGAQGVLLVFDLTERKSLDNCTFWLEEIRKNAAPDTGIILIGNKCDLHHQRKITHEEAQAFASQASIDYLEASALNSANVHLIFETIAKHVISKRVSKNLFSSKNNCTLEVPAPAKSHCCF